MRKLISVVALGAIALLCVPVAFASTGSFGAASSLTCAQGRTGIAPTASITFTAPTTNTDGTPIAGPLTYDILQGTSPSSLSVVAKGVSGSPVLLNTGLSPGTTAYFAVVVVDAHGNQSAMSNVACKTFPASVPATVVIQLT